VAAGTAITGTTNIADGDAGPHMAGAALLAASEHEAWTAAMKPRGDAIPIAIVMGGLKFGPGTMRSETSLSIAAGLTVTLDGGGNPDSEFLFQAGTTMGIGAGAKIELINEAKAENVIWALGSTFTAGAFVDLEGTILAGTAVTFGANVVLNGSIVAGSAVTFGALNEIHGSVVAETAITFGAGNIVTESCIP
jgi:hypothetical protein